MDVILENTKRRIAIRTKRLMRAPHEALRDGWSKVRRFYLTNYRPDYVGRIKAMREGDCGRCGMCCRILFRCPHLDGEHHCTIYERRYEQCRTFPIDARDLQGLEGFCGYRFQSPCRRRAAETPSLCVRKGTHPAAAMGDPAAA